MLTDEQLTRLGAIAPNADLGGMGINSRTIMEHIDAQAARIQELDSQLRTAIQQRDAYLAQRVEAQDRVAALERQIDRLRVQA